MTEKILGIGCSPGFALGSFFYPEKQKKLRVFQGNTQEQWDLLQKALVLVQEEFHKALSLFEIHSEGILLIETFKAYLEDPLILETLHKNIFEKKLEVSTAVVESFSQIKKLFSSISHSHILEKEHDIDSVCDFLLEKLDLLEEPHLQEHIEGHIVVIETITPRDVLFYSKYKIAGFISKNGTRSSHASILCRNLNIPAVLGLKNSFEDCLHCQRMIMNGWNGQIFKDPSEELWEKFIQKREQWLLWKEQENKTIRPKHDFIHFFCNKDSASDTYGLPQGEGVGLMRLEFFYISQKTEPSEELLEKEILRISEQVKHQEVTVRLLDVGGDKEIPLCCQKEETKLLLSDDYRGVRVLMKNPAILKRQIRAIVRANIQGNIKILVPFVTSVDEMIFIKNVLKEIWREESLLHDIKMPLLGMMVELPAAVALLPQFCKEVDFFSIGTNDLSQYTLAAQRNDILFSDTFVTYHPAILRFIKDIIDISQTAQVPVTLCGELASNPLLLETLVGMGLQQFSCHNSIIPVQQEILSHLQYFDAKSLATEILQYTNSEHIYHRLQRRLLEIAEKYEIPMLYAFVFE